MIQYIQIAPIASAIFFLTVGVSLLALYRDESLIDRLILHPYGMFRKGEYYRMVSHALIHADGWHLFFNMYSFQAFAFILEYQMGSLKFLILYVACIVLSSLSTAVKYKNFVPYRSLGASGGVSGVIFAFILLEPTSKISFMFIPVGVPAIVFAVLYLLYSYYSSINQYDNVNHEAHFWGSVTGVGIMGLFYPELILSLFSMF